MTCHFALEWIERKLDGAAAGCANADNGLSDLGLLRPVVVAASVLGDEIEPWLLARMFEMEERHATQVLSAAAAAGHLTRHDGDRGSTYRFVDAELCATAYDAIERTFKARLHRRAAEVLSDGRGANNLAVAVRIARHFEAADAWHQAVRWWRLAGELAIQSGATTAAVGYLWRALAITAPEGNVMSPEDELATLSLLGPLQAQLCGSGSPDVADIYAHCLEIAGRFDQPETTARLDALWGLTACILVHGRVETARELCRKLLRSAEAIGEVGQILLASRLDGLGSLLAGEIGPAISAFERVGVLYEFRIHAALRFQYASDQLAVALAHKSWAEAIAGDRDASDNSCAAALRQSERLQHPHTSAHVACVLAARAATLRQRTEAAPLANAGLALARRHRFPYWEAWADLILGWHEAGRNLPAGAARVERAIVAYQVTGAGQAMPFAHLLRADLALSAGHLPLALSAADMALMPISLVPAQFPAT
jgi:hypothetical protein